MGIESFKKQEGGRSGSEGGGGKNSTQSMPRQGSSVDSASMYSNVGVETGGFSNGGGRRSQGV